MSEPILSSKAETQIQFFHLDPMNIVWHGNYADFFELARVELMEKIDYGYSEMVETGYGWPVTELKIRYASPLLLRMKISITAHLVEWENRLKIKYEIREKETNKKLCSGHTVQVAIDNRSGEMLWLTPDVFRDKLGPYLK